MARRQKPKNLRQIKAEILDEEYEPVRESRGLLWLIFRAPGAFLLWWEYINPSKGNVLGSARRRGHAVNEVFATFGFYVAVLILIVWGYVVTHH